MTSETKLPAASPAKPKQTSGFLMSIVRTLSASADYQQREKEKARIEKAFKESDKRSGDLVKENYQDLTSILTSFSAINDRINESRGKIKKIKDDLSSCKTLLHCKRDELRRLWIEGVEQKTIAALLDQIEQVKDVPSRLDGFLAKKLYLHATNLIGSSVAKLESNLAGVEALRDLKVELMSRKERMHEILIEELNRQIYVASSQVSQRLNRAGSGRRGELTGKSLMDYANPTAPVAKDKSTMSVQTKLSEDVMADPEDNPQKFISILIESLFILRKIPEAAEAIKMRMHPELIAIVARASHQVIDSIGGQGENLSTQFQPRNLLDLLEIIFCQFRCVANVHKIVLQNLHRIMNSGVHIRSEYLYGMKDVWSKIQAVIQLLLSEYLDIRNTEKSRQQAPSSFDEPNMDIGLYFTKKRPNKPKKDSQEQDGSEDLFDDQDTTGTVTLRDIMLELKELRGVIEKMQNPSRPFRIQESIYKGRFQNQLKDLFSKDPWLSVSNDAFQMEVKRIIRRAGYSGDTTATGNLYSFATTQFTYFRNMLKRKVLSKNLQKLSIPELSTTLLKPFLPPGHSALDADRINLIVSLRSFLHTRRYFEDHGSHESFYKDFKAYWDQIKASDRPNKWAELRSLEETRIKRSTETTQT